MATAKISQKEYLKKYLSNDSASNDKKKKKKKAKSGAVNAVTKANVRIIDDDYDISQMQQISDKDLEVYAIGEDAPQIVGVFDERPAELIAKEDYKQNEKWKVLAAVDGSLTINNFDNAGKMKSSNSHGPKEPEKRFTKYASDDDLSPVRLNERALSVSSDNSPERRHTSNRSKPSRFADRSPERKSRRSRSPEQRRRRDKDYSPERPRDKKRNYSPKRNRGRSSSSEDNHRKRRVSPARRKDSRSPKRNTTNDKYTSRRDRSRSPYRTKSPKKRRDSDASPPRGRKESPSRNRKESPQRNESKQKKSNSSPPRRQKDNTPPRRRRDSDASPPRRRRDADASPTRRQPDSDASPPRKRRDSDASPPRRRKAADASPPRRRRDSDASPPRRRNDSDASPPRKRRDSDASPPRRRKPADSSPPRRRRNSDESPPRRPQVKQERSPDASPPRRRKVSPARQIKPDSAILTSKKLSRWSRDRSECPTGPSKMKKTLDGKSAGLQSANSVRQENNKFRQQEEEFFSKMSKDPSGHAEAVTRDRKTGRIRDVEAEMEVELEKMRKEQETKAVYDRWGKGVKQVEDHQVRQQDAQHEYSKPLARYADDKDLDALLKNRDRDGDPMLEYLRSKESAKDSGKPAKPIYKGAYPENRFGIRPGYRWDGVDRSSGFEKKWFDVQSKKKASEEEEYKYMTEDM